ncbi:prepilin-type N-terminal cleavage/methylation domain-containing protein [Aureimonas pseudogalii]|uniref:Type II secretory pathway pseudopilin PulG n=1 Tax=Aureimonas pseudogalii TaxID=1744844 RepID=A0A7W6H8P5_9HYPH|nr:prepilin-type N-terminal cleavage/methylation domain-containing protein [Aureimonas pseudogalii]MBB4000651.1 type II secretory pathway pseudopilin PulG [Aureimonas pseudogalii]
MSASGDGGQDGFALAEVLVAFAILALVSIAMIRAFAGTTQTFGATAAREAELSLAQHVLEGARAESSASAGRQEGESGDLTWWRKTTPADGAGLAPPPRTPRLFRVEVGVSRKGETKSRPPLLTSFILARSADE